MRFCGVIGGFGRFSSMVQAHYAPWQRNRWRRATNRLASAIECSTRTLSLRLGAFLSLLDPVHHAAVAIAAVGEVLGVGVLPITARWPR